MEDQLRGLSYHLTDSHGAGFLLQTCGGIKGYKRFPDSLNTPFIPSACWKQYLHRHVNRLYRGIDNWFAIRQYESRAAAFL